MKKRLTGAKARNDPKSRINLALKKWRCNCGSVNKAKAVSKAKKL